jgi:BT4734-like, N-terminal domain/Protein of unknown function (DUF3987)/Primase C terminal 2 (PriCT-2)
MENDVTTVEGIDTIEVEFFQKVNDRKNHKPINLIKFLNWAQKDEKLEKRTKQYHNFLKQNPNAIKKEISAKKLELFPSVIFGGTFTGTGKASDINVMSGLIVIDIDHLGKTFEDVKRDLENDQYTYLLFVSPSGDGIKLVVKHDLTDSENWEYLYNELEEYYVHTHLINIDKSGKDISRMCYIPFLNDLIINENPIIYKYDGKFERQQRAIKEAEDKSDVEFVKPKITDELYTECFYMSKFLKENKINITDNYDDWLGFGFSLAEFGENGREIFHNISSVSEKYDLSETDAKYDNLLQEFNGDKSGIKKFLVVAKEQTNKLLNFKIKNDIILPPKELYNDLPSILKLPLTKYQGVQKFMALIAGIANISGVLPKLRVKHYGTYEYGANLFAWIIARQSTGKNVINEMQKLTELIEKKIEKDCKREYAMFMERKTIAETNGDVFTESYPDFKSLYLGADLTKAALVQKLKKNDGRAIISTTEAATLIGSNKSKFGSFIDLILAAYGHERYQKDLNDKQYIIAEPYLSLSLSSTPETAYSFFGADNVENGLLSRFLTFEINSENELKFIKNHFSVEGFDDVLETNKKNIYRIWSQLSNLKEYLYLDLSDKIDKHLFDQYAIYEKEAKYIYKFTPDVVKRMWVMHKRLLLIFSALFHYEKYSTFDIEWLNETNAKGWEFSDKIKCDDRAIMLSDSIMYIYREAFIRLMYGIERQKYKNMNVSTRNDNIMKMKMNGYSNEYVANMFDIPITMVENASASGRVKFTPEQKDAVIQLDIMGIDKKILGKAMGVGERTIQKWCKMSN